MRCHAPRKIELIIFIKRTLLNFPADPQALLSIVATVGEWVARALHSQLMHVQWNNYDRKTWGKHQAIQQFLNSIYLPKRRVTSNGNQFRSQILIDPCPKSGFQFTLLITILTIANHLRTRGSFPFAIWTGEMQYKYPWKLNYSQMTWSKLNSQWLYGQEESTVTGIRVPGGKPHFICQIESSHSLSASSAPRLQSRLKEICTKRLERNWRETTATKQDWMGQIIDVQFRKRAQKGHSCFIIWFWRLNAQSKIPRHGAINLTSAKGCSETWNSY